MLSYISAKEAAEKLNISQRRVSVLASENRKNGAMMVGNMWIIPSNAEKPIDKRTVRYEKSKSVTLKPFVKSTCRANRKNAPDRRRKCFDKICRTYGWRWRIVFQHTFQI